MDERSSLVLLSGTGSGELWALTWSPTVAFSPTSHARHTLPVCGHISATDRATSSQQHEAV